MSVKLLLAKAHVEGIRGFDVYRREGGYQSVEKALKQMNPESIVEEVKKSGLRGRGGAGFPAGMKWSFIAKPEGVPRHLVCNADESEPGTFKDGYLMEFLPHLLIEGLIVSSFALGSNDTYIYIRGEYAWIVDILEDAINEAKANGFLGKNILGTGFDCEIHVQRGAGAYICGEETALIESLEGKRGNPRIKPPFPAIQGVWQRPTMVNNVETLASVVPIINMGGEEYAKIGVGKSTGTKLISACGNINKPGVYEIDMTISVEDFIYSDEYCGGIANGKKLKACIPGGSSVPILPANLLLKTAKGEFIVIFDADEIEFIRSLPDCLTIDAENYKVCVFHGSPRNTDEYIYPDTDLGQLHASVPLGARWIILGHTHYPMDREFNGVRFINPGSVGQSRNGVSKAFWAILDTEADVVEMKSTE